MLGLREWGLFVWELSLIGGSSLAKADLIEGLLMKIP